MVAMGWARVRGEKKNDTGKGNKFSVMRRVSSEHLIVITVNNMLLCT